MESTDAIVISDSESEEYWGWVENMQLLLHTEAVGMQEVEVTDIVEILDSEQGGLVISNGLC